MPEDRAAKPGECISSIAEQAGFFWNTLWDHAANADLKELREDPNTLMPGDIVHIPDLREKEEPAETGAFHRFKKRGIPAQIRLQMFDGEEYRDNQDYEFIVDNTQRHSGKTDDEGVLKISISPLAKAGKLIIGEDKKEYEFDFGRLPPDDTLEGVKARMQNLGFYFGEIDNELDDVTRDALLAFQRRFDLEETGEPDQATRDKLDEMHDNVDDFPEKEKQENDESLEELPPEEE